MSIPKNLEYNAAMAPFLGLFAEFKAAGKEFYAVGGCVRDILLGHPPKDFDFTTDATPTEIKAILHQNHRKAIALGENFGTIATIIHGKTYEITTYRVKESYKKGSRHPVVLFGNDLYKDLERRDLSINAMAMDEAGSIIDPFGGRADLLAQILRVPNSSYEKSIEIFTDDPLRILRLARFLGRLAFSVDPDAQDAARLCAPQILHVSAERYKSELEGLLHTKNAKLGIKWLLKYKVLGFIIPEIVPLQALSLHFSSLNLDKTTLLELPQSLEQSWLQALDSLPQSCALRWGWLLMLLGAPVAATAQGALGLSVLSLRQANEIMQRLKFSNAERAQILAILHPYPEVSPDPCTARRLAITLGKDLGAWLELQNHKLLILAQSEQERERERLLRWESLLLPYIEHPELAPVLLPKDLSQVLQTELHVHGKGLGMLLEAIQEAIISGELPTTVSSEQCVNYARKNLI